jgi:hypothetical protein
MCHKLIEGLVGCWVGAKYLPERILGEYVWLWFTGLSSVVLYILLYFCIRGNIEVDNHKWWRIHFRRRRLAAPSAVAKDAFILLL